MRTFSSKIPSDLLYFDNVDRISKLLDEINDFKRGEINYFNRSYKTLTNPYKKRLIDKLHEFGIPLPQENYPLILLQNLVLNGGEIQRLRGSLKGIILFVQSATLGLVSNVDASGYFPVFPFIFPNDLFGGGGLLPESADDDIKHLIDPDDLTLDSYFSFDISTYFHNNSSVKDYVENAIFSMMPFFEGSSGLTISWSCGELNPVQGMYPFINDAAIANNISSCDVDSYLSPSTTDVFSIDRLSGTNINSWTSLVAGTVGSINYITPKSAKFIDNEFLRFDFGLNLETSCPAATVSDYMIVITFRADLFINVWKFITTDTFSLTIDSSSVEGKVIIYDESSFNLNDPKTWIEYNVNDWNTLCLVSKDSQYTVYGSVENADTGLNSITYAKNSGLDSYINFFDILSKTGYIDVSGILVTETIPANILDTKSVTKITSLTKPKINF